VFQFIGNRYDDAEHGSHRSRIVTKRFFVELPRRKSNLRGLVVLCPKRIGVQNELHCVGTLPRQARDALALRTVEGLLQAVRHCARDLSHSIAPTRRCHPVAPCQAKLAKTQPAVRGKTQILLRDEGSQAELCAGQHRADLVGEYLGTIRLQRIRV
jgi:hypothetical protein